MSDGKGKSNHYSPVKSQPKTGFMHFLYNSDTGEVLGRSGLSWFKITVFYICFFAGLACFFGLMLWIFLTTLNDKEPRYKGDSSLIGTNPGVGFRPMPDQDKNVESTLIWFKQGDDKDGEIWANEIDKFIDMYAKPPPGDKASCRENEMKPDHAKEIPCAIDVSTLTNCSRENDRYGYIHGRAQPCVIIKLNKIYGWFPDAYTGSDDDMKMAESAKMPKELQDHIRSLSNATIAPGTPSGAPNKMNTTWITCEGENPADKENIGQLGYFYPGFSNKWNDPTITKFGGIPNNNFPFLNQDAYLAPFIFVKFLRPQPNVLIQVECKAWAKNIKPDRQQRLGSVHFELMVD